MTTSLDTSLGSACTEMWPCDCLQYTEWESWVGHVFHILVSLPVCGIPEVAVTQTQLCRWNTATRNSKATQKDLGPWEISVQWIIFLGPFQIILWRGEDVGREKRKDLSLRQIYCPLVTSLNLLLHWILFSFLILTWRWILTRCENAPLLGHRPRLSLFFLVSFDFGVRFFCFTHGDDHVLKSLKII